MGAGWWSCEAGRKLRMNWFYRNKSQIFMHTVFAIPFIHFTVYIDNVWGWIAWYVLLFAMHGSIADQYDNKKGKNDNSHNI